MIRPGGMGDLIVLQAAAEHLGIDPVKDVSWLIESRSAPWAERQGLRYYCYDRWDDVRRLIQRDPWKLLANSEQRYGLSQAATRCLSAQNSRVVCFETNRCAADADVRVAYDSRGGFEGDAFAALLAGLTGKPPPPPMKLRRRQRPAERRPILALAGSQVPSRAFSAGNYADLVMKWFGREQAVDIAYAPADRELAQAVKKCLTGGGQLLDMGFSALCEEIAQAECLATIDGGMVHVASYYGVPVRCVFTSGIVSKWRPWSEGSMVWSVDGLACQPCCHFGVVPPCPHGYACKVTAHMVPKPG